MHDYTNLTLYLQINFPSPAPMYLNGIALMHHVGFSNLVPPATNTPANTGAMHHPCWLSKIPALVGSQEVVKHTHKLAQLIGPNLHVPIVWGGKSLDNGITSCDPTGAGILDNQGRYTYLDFHRR